ncbi:beta-lactam binding protein AmpH [Legionella gratiana]|uniref:Beta-lactam binding protein AmpH n=1 Tax=Legionella gratiana TaxID=45066 RepID=A0A378JA21_9GAMM|nr:serine hydrolase [Legionella gratiana]KTD06571.1 beta-lactam binding protein AmpH [Legionella gratiana]STX44694.1 beta-lactam binding protein AmpH [Legionella gratiana]
MIKGFLKERPPIQWNNTPVDRDQWSSIIDNEFREIESNLNKMKFLNLFEHISDMDILSIDKGEGFGIAKQNALKEEITVQLSREDERDISDYMTDMNMSASVSILSEGKTSTICTEGNDEKSIFSTHSVGKIFTGVLILRLVEQGILKEEDLNKPIQVSESAKAKLPAKVVERLKDVTLHDMMTHRGGLGDFVGNYVKDVKNSLEKEIKLPKIENLEDFLVYANDELSDQGKTRYSNLGSLLVGLAAEYAYAEYQKIHSELSPMHFNEMLQEFIQKPSGMITLTDRSPSGAKVNTSKTITEPTPESPHLIANPSGGYWTSVSDLQKLGQWLYNKAQQNDFARLISKYGQEFHLDDNTLGHKGENPSASAMLSVSLSNGRVIATLSNSSRTHAHDLEESIRENIFSKPVNAIVKDEATHQFRDTLKQMKGLAPTPTEDNEIENKNPITPFKTTPKPPWEQ